MKSNEIYLENEIYYDSKENDLIVSAIFESIKYVFQNKTEKDL